MSDRICAVCGGPITDLATNTSEGLVHLARRDCVAHVRATMHRQLQYAAHMVACADTVTLLKPEEVENIYRRALSGEFNDELDWRSLYRK
ncbi:MAG TPA: hypothetical protein VFO46_02395 [Candidatus Sulfotelmatobacter sp.]|nr:hypothetical protein [Candidatus Sulfotelmatobacter sp.]